MRLFLLAIAVAMTSLFALPILIVMVPSAVFRVYLHFIPIQFDHPHVQDALASISEIRSAAFCLLPPYISLNMFCTTSGGAGLKDVLPIELLLLNQQTAFEACARYGPTPRAIASLYLLAQSTSAGLVLDTAIAYVDGESVGRDAGETHALEEIANLSMAAAGAFYRFLVQLEVAVCR